MKISALDSRYFSDDSGKSFVPVGLNLCFHRQEETLPEEEILRCYENWFRNFSGNGGNFSRLWLGKRFFDVMPESVGKYDEKAAAHLLSVIRLAEKYRIRLKLTLEHFRRMEKQEDVPQFEDFSQRVRQTFNKSMYLPYASRMEEYLTSPVCRKAYLDRARYLASAGIGDSPAVAAIELWNEINCIGDVYGTLGEWSRFMLRELQTIFPKQMILQNLGSFSEINGYRIYDSLDGLEGNGFLQVHRYLDPGAPMDVCRGPADVLCADAVRYLRNFRTKTPVILAECGAVEARHSGPSLLYDKDKEGTLLHDMLFAPFFAGSAGCGQFWHWTEYVAKNDLWYHFRRFSRAIEGVDPAAEHFVPFYTETSRLREYGLRGKTVDLCWLRDKKSDWRSELAEGIPAETLTEERFYAESPGEFTAYLPWEDRWEAMKPDGKLPPFRRSLVVRCRKEK